jgi:hypothetical protein
VFICDKCHTGPRQGLCGLSVSVGPCEGCGYTRRCSDCQCDHPVKTAERKKVMPKP